MQNVELIDIALYLCIPLLVHLYPIFKKSFIHILPSHIVSSMAIIVAIADDKPKNHQILYKST